MGSKRGRPFKGEERMSTRMGFRIQNSMLDDVLAICEEEGITRSDFITRALEREISRIAKSDPITKALERESSRYVTNYMEESK